MDRTSHDATQEDDRQVDDHTPQERRKMQLMGRVPFRGGGSKIQRARMAEGSLGSRLALAESLRIRSEFSFDEIGFELTWVKEAMQSRRKEVGQSIFCRYGGGSGRVDSVSGDMPQVGEVVTAGMLGKRPVSPESVSTRSLFGPFILNGTRMLYFYVCGASRAGGLSAFLSFASKLGLAMDARLCVILILFVCEFGDTFFLKPAIIDTTDTTARDFPVSRLFLTE
ncbi:hypothetical protein BU17DRAFT_61804 [Hysterangium stoloniferum]|nr:hypothetical protein BU17DRAFT_61804 [Hysterangium stoloniferum]